VSRKKRILIVEDDSDTRGQLGLLVELLGYETILCADGPEAHKCFDKQLVDLVLMDLILPRGDGVDLIADFHRKKPEVPVIILTGYPSEGSIRESLTSEPYAYLTKPISGEQLADLLERALAAKTA
jgi:two-component system response regulator PilR (NtrC family)